MTQTKTKFHGMTVVSDCETIKDNHVVEVTSGYDVVCRYYDEGGMDHDEPIILNDILLNPFAKNEANITGAIKRRVGRNTLMISESVVKQIQAHFV